VDEKLQLCPEVRKMDEGLGREIPMYKGNERDFVRVQSRSVKRRMEARYCNGDKYIPGVVDLEEERVVWVD
jgi:hypothetical protein